MLRSIGLTERDLPSEKFDFVQADKATHLLSMGQMDFRVRYESSVATITVVFCPGIKGMLISWLDCIALRILHHDYPRPLVGPRSPVAVKVVNEASVRDGPIP